MLKKILVATAAVCVAVTFSACSSIEVGTTLNGQKLTDVDTVNTLGHVNADIWGIYLFNFPLFTGSSAQTGRCAVFRDTVTIDNGVSLLTREAGNKLEATKVINVQSERSSAWIFPLLIFWYKDVQVSGNGIR